MNEIKHTETSSHWHVALTAMTLLLGGCAATMIPNTDVPDSPEAREVVDFCEDYRQAVASMNVEALMRFADGEYYDDMGTPSGDDDVDFDSLRSTLKERFGERISGVHYDIRYRDVVFLEQRVLVDYTYIGRFKVAGKQGTRWERRGPADNRLVLSRTDAGYKVLSGM